MEKWEVEISTASLRWRNQCHTSENSFDCIFKSLKNVAQLYTIHLYTSSFRTIILPVIVYTKIDNSLEQLFICYLFFVEIKLRNFIRLLSTLRHCTYTHNTNSMQRYKSQPLNYYTREGNFYSYPRWSSFSTPALLLRSTYPLEKRIKRLRTCACITIWQWIQIN